MKMKMKMKKGLILQPQEGEMQTRILGGKGYHLFRLKDWGVNVPPFAVVTSSSYHQWLKDGRLPAALIQEVKEVMDSWKAEFVSVRSSMDGEDGKDVSFAGLMESFLYVKREELEETIYECFKSAELARIEAYKEKKGLTGKNEPIKNFAVVVQKMVFADASGVSFSRTPVGDSSLSLIEAAYGLGEGVVSGLVEVDSYSLDRFHQIQESRIEKKLKMVCYRPLPSREPGVSATGLVSVPEHLQERPVLSLRELEELNQKVFEIEAFFGAPVDIEWAIERGVDQEGTAYSHLYFLQMRPITQSFSPLEYFIDTNLSESYPGLTAPLSGDFVTRAYTKVYREVGDYLGLPPRRQEKLEPHYQRLVQYVGGHLYYHLPSYYHLLHSMPGGKKNIENWHRMIGGAPILDENTVLKNAHPLGPWEVFLYYWGILKLVIFHERIFGDFCGNAEAQEKELMRKTVDGKKARELIVLLQKKFAAYSGFGLTALNDYLIMLSMRPVVKILKKYGYGEQDLPSFIKTQEGVESLKPIQDMHSLCETIRQKDGFMQEFARTLAAEEARKDLLVGEDLWPAILQELQERGFQDQADKIRSYLDAYGDRSFEELKLESLTFKQAPGLFLRLLQWKLSAETNAEGGHPPGFSFSSEVQDLRPFGPVMGYLLGKLLNQTQKFIAMREKTRLVRGRYYGWVRTVLVKIFQCLQREFPSDLGSYTLNHFFALNFQVLFDFADGKISVQDMKKRIEDFKGWESGPQDYPEFLCLSRDTLEKEAGSFSRKRAEGLEKSQGGGGGDGQGEGPLSLQGLGASKGRIRGEVLVLSDPREALHFDLKDFKNKILVTKNTDPAWVYIITQCAGLISEKGSLLSHTAIIGRELGIPTVVGVKNAVHFLKNYSFVEIDGETGAIIGTKESKR